MDIRRVTPGEYTRAFAESPHVFNTVAFSELNAWKCRQIHYLLISDTRLRAGFILGETDTTLSSPFSAPFGGPTFTRPQHLTTICAIFRTLNDYAHALSKDLRITLPPMWHNPGTLSQCVSALSILPGAASVIDVCYHMPLGDSADPLPHAVARARGALRQALARPFTFTVGDASPHLVQRAYDIVKANHTQRGHPVRMAPDDMLRTAAMMNADTFFLTTPDGTDAAAAIVFTTLPSVAQPILWGDNVSLHDHRTMHRLCFEIARFYAARRYSVFDLGPASLHGIPDLGLAFFKESLGFTPSLRYTFHIPR